jgi:hypothetical protein
MSYLKALKRKELLSVVSKGWFGGYMARLGSQEANPGSQDTVARRHPGSLGSAPNGPPGPLPLTAKVGAACGVSSGVSDSGKMGKKKQNQSSTERVLPKSGMISDLIARMNFSLTPNKVQELEKYGRHLGVAALGHRQGRGQRAGHQSTLHRQQSVRSSGVTGGDL